ncbi:hypothetical protein ACWED2_02445 [Amycolatopsis sp. NPDC005003]
MSTRLPIVAAAVLAACSASAQVAAGLVGSMWALIFLLLTTLTAGMSVLMGNAQIIRRPQIKKKLAH